RLPSPARGAHPRVGEPGRHRRRDLDRRSHRDRVDVRVGRRRVRPAHAGGDVDREPAGRHPPAPVPPAPRRAPGRVRAHGGRDLARAPGHPGPVAAGAARRRGGDRRRGLRRRGIPPLPRGCARAPRAGALVAVPPEDGMTPNQKLAISVVIPYYNGSRFIAEALASVRAQTLAPLEVIVVDDCSRPDDAAAVYREAPDCVVIHLPKNRGPSVARNIGIARARGEWIAFLDCDDLWAPRKLELQAAVVAANADCRAVHCGMTTILPGGKEVVYDKGEVTFEDFLEFPCPIFPSAVLMQRQALFECGLFDPTKRC